MADEKEPTPSQPADEKEPNPPTGDKPENAIPYARFKEVNEQLKALKEEKDKRDLAERTAQEDKLKKEKKFEELIQTVSSERDTYKKERDDYSAKVKAVEEKEKARRDALLSKIEDKELREIAEKLPDADSILAFTEKISNNKGGPNEPRGGNRGGESNPFKRKQGETFPDYDRRIGRLPAAK